MSEILTQVAEESVPQEQPVAPEKPAAEGGEKKGEAMPPEERARQAAKRRAAESRTLISEAERERQIRQEVLAHPLVKEAMSLLEETRFRKDLDCVREAYPQLTAQSPLEVGEVYCRLMASGKVDPLVAYEAQIAADRRRNPAPSDMVSAKAVGGASAYYSSRELDRLTPADLKDPGIFRKAMASLSKLNNKE